MRRCSWIYFQTSFTHPGLRRLIAEEGSTTVALARVLPSLGKTRADHGIGYGVPGEKIPSEMEVAPRFELQHCFHCWHCSILISFLTRLLRKRRCNLHRSPQAQTPWGRLIMSTLFKSLWKGIKELVFFFRKKVLNKGAGVQKFPRLSLNARFWP